MWPGQLTRSPFPATIPGQMTTKLRRKRLAVLGAGKIGGILLRAFLKHGLITPKNAVATVRHPDRARMVSEQLKIRVSTDNCAATREADIILVSVKPQTVGEVLEEIRSEV